MLLALGLRALALSLALHRRSPPLFPSDFFRSSPALSFALRRRSGLCCAGALFLTSSAFPSALRRHLSLHYDVALQSAIPAPSFGLRRRSSPRYASALLCAAPPLQSTMPALHSTLRWPYPTCFARALFSTANSVLKRCPDDNLIVDVNVLTLPT